jgi:predicted Rossmann fold flavoprotein
LALLRHQRVTITLELLPQWDTSTLTHLLETLFTNAPQLTLHEALSTLLPLKILPHLLASVTISPDTSVTTMTTKKIQKVIHGIKHWDFEVSDTHGFKHAEASGGGVSTAEVNPKTMESTVVKGLYFAGEVLDIVGQRGGYNFHFAWASGMIAGESIGSNNGRCG